MLTVGIMVFIVGILLFIYSVYAMQHTNQLNRDVEAQNRALEESNEELEKINNDLNNTKSLLDNDIFTKKQQLIEVQTNITSVEKMKEQLSQAAFERYCQILDSQYEEYEEEYDMYKDALETSYSNRQLELMRELDEVQKDLDTIKATRTAAIQAQTREKEIQEKLSFYCLDIAETELRDAKELEAFAPRLNNPRILYMLIWQSFYRTPMNNLCNRVIGTETKSGIYKITNQKTQECYIGQAVDLAARWKTHAKCGLHIDTPNGNKLYKAMQEYGIQNFSWEVLEEVPPARLNEQENYYIELYDAVNFGYNSIKAPTKGKTV